MKQLITVLILAHLCIVSANAQKLTLKTMVEATACHTEECFIAALTPYDLCYKRTRNDSTGTYYRHQNCGADSIGNKRLIVHFAVLRDGHFNSSFLTWSGDYADGLKKELAQLQFKSMANPDDPNKSRTWYHSETYPRMNIMWEELADAQQVKRWHVGLVWE